MAKKAEKEIMPASEDIQKTELVSEGAQKTEPKKTEPKKTERILIPIDDDHREPVFVGINGKTYLIKRGEEIDVPREVAEVLRNANEQRLSAIKYMDEHTDRN